MRHVVISMAAGDEDEAADSCRQRRRRRRRRRLRLVLQRVAAVKTQLSLQQLWRPPRQLLSDCCVSFVAVSSLGLRPTSKATSFHDYLDPRSMSGQRITFSV